MIKTTNKRLPVTLNKDQLEKVKQLQTTKQISMSKAIAYMIDQYKGEKSND